MKTGSLTFEVAVKNRGTRIRPGKKGVLLYVSPNDPWQATCEFVTPTQARRMASLLLRAAEKVERYGDSKGNGTRLRG